MSTNPYGEHLVVSTRHIHNTHSLIVGPCSEKVFIWKTYRSYEHPYSSIMQDCPSWLYYYLLAFPDHQSSIPIGNGKIRGCTILANLAE
jgi:hypothetical protein